MVDLDGMSGLAVIVLRLMALTHHLVRLIKQMLMVALSIPEVFVHGA